MKKKLIVGMTALVLATTPTSQWTPVTEAATASSKITAVSQVVKPIYISKKSYFSLVDVTLAPADEGKIATFTLAVYNGDSKELNLLDYWFRLSNLSGNSYPLKQVVEESKKIRIAPNTKSYITLYAKLGDNIKLSDLVFRLVKFDFSGSNYERGIGRFAFPKNYTNEVKSTSYKALYFSNTTLYSKVSGSSLSSSGEDHFVSVDFVYNNVGKRAVTLAKYKYYIVTSEGILYEAHSSVNGEITIQPQKRQELQLTATVPSNLKASNWKLVVMRESGGETALFIPVGSYQLSLTGSSTGGVVTDTFKYATSKGSYQFKLSQLSRQPWENQDVLSARIRILNSSKTTSAPVPNITGYFYLDNQVKLDFKPVESNNQIGLNANGYVDVDVYAMIPGTYKYSNVKLVVNDKKDEQLTTKAGELSGSSLLSQLPIYAVDKVYSMPREGSSMNAGINSVKVFEGNTTKLFSVQMTLSSIERRTIDPIKLVGVFVNDNGDTFPAQTSMGEGRINPGNKALATFVATVPLNYSTANLRLIVGEGVTDTKYTTGSTTPEGYVGAVMYNLPMEQRLMTVMKEIPLLPYKLTINKFIPRVFDKDLELTLDYDLEKDTSYNVYPADRKLLMSIEGQDINDGKIYNYYSQEIALEGDSETALQAGKNIITLKKTLNIDTVDGRLNYYAKIYEVVSGSKKLVAEHPFYWFIENDWSKDVASPN